MKFAYFIAKKRSLLINIIQIKLKQQNREIDDRHMYITKIEK